MHRYAFAKRRGENEDPPLWIFVAAYMSYLILIVIGHLRDFIGKLFIPQAYAHLHIRDGYAPLYSDFESFYTRRLYTRIRDCWNRPMTKIPGRVMTLIDRVSPDYNQTFKFTGTETDVLNLSSYNYLGFAETEGACIEADIQALHKYGIATCSSYMEVGKMEIHKEMERTVARFLNKEDVICFPMGFATNSTTLPSFVRPGCLIISDELNHSSLVVGARTSGASIQVFRHNDMLHLEECLRSAIAQGQPRTHRPWKKILVLVESLYSMEGTILDLPALIDLKRKYKVNSS
jgi:7-keto-8-aminopelargonate synthetase-like enzyme